MKETINSFVENKTIAIAGVSNRAGNFGLGIMTEIQQNGYTVIPVNPNHEIINEDKCYPSVKALPAEVENLIIVTNPERATQIISEALQSNIKRIWLHKGIGKGAVSEKNLEILKASKIEYVYGFCPMMFLGKAGLHKFHFWMRKNLGKVPEEYKK